MDVVVPWGELEALIEPYYPKAGNGRQPVGLTIMLRVYFLQQWFNLSDSGAEDALYESSVLRRFAGVDLGRAAAPDETTILRFRRILEQHELCGQILNTVNSVLIARQASCTRCVPRQLQYQMCICCPTYCTVTRKRCGATQLPRAHPCSRSSSARYDFAASKTEGRR